MDTQGPALLYPEELAISGWGREGGCLLKAATVATWLLIGQIDTVVWAAEVEVEGRGLAEGRGARGEVGGREGRGARGEVGGREGRVAREEVGGRERTGPLSPSTGVALSKEIGYQLPHNIFAVLTLWPICTCSGVNLHAHNKA